MDKHKGEREQAGRFSTMPNLQYVVQQVRDSQAWDFTTKDGLCSYCNACVYALYQVDPGFGHLTKSDGQNHCVDPDGRNCATDVALYKPTGQICDFIVSAGFGTPPPPNDVCWFPGEMNEYPASSWFAPVPNAGGDTGGGTPTPPDGGGASDDQIAAMQAQLDRIEKYCVDQSLFLSNINDQINLMAGVVNDLRASQNPPYGGTMVRDGRELTLNPKG